ncbi:Lipopolysaccharide biosynthesis protein WzxC [Sedimentisphaera cyanobacteriorum]|uniref:Lipopolysaccharide biosynthesis protein WzxC n=1 Tax=Sedimentisphaera cyanobacteriorum TaxID=1940790 RepID=A0A1Q2HRQ1_9BACT|nr:lipopolysaccharide biosynthesis protein [Sedimentisphaera cyanobacteriorum]AQQ10102.1 Lipopolysaccharide biosynthesis protein WzxC [Sedimentisphaera cyanobacteriorum]
MSDNQTQKPHKDLYKKTLQSGGWVFGLRLFNHLLSIVRLGVLAIFLTPEQFGVVGAGLLLVEVLETFTQTGFNQSLIAKKGSVENWLNTAWTAGLIRAGILYSIIFFASPFAAELKASGELAAQTTMIMRVLGLLIIIKAMNNPGVLYFSKDLRFDKVFKINSISNTAAAVVSIAAAFYYRSAWAIVIGKILGALLSAAGGYIMHSFRPRIEINLKKLKDMWGFGKWITGGRIVSFLINQGDDFLVWFYLGMKPLGLYQMSYKISTIPGDYVSKTLNTTLFPAMSKISEDKERMRSAYLKLFRMVFTFSCPVVVCLILGSEFLWLILGSKWAPAIPVIQILCIKGFFQTMGTSRGPVFLSMGRPNIAFRIKLVRFVFLAAVIFPLASNYGVQGVAWAVAAAAALPQPLGFYWTNRLLGIRASEYFPLIVPGLLLGLAAVLGIWGAVFIASIYI